MSINKVDLRREMKANRAKMSADEVGKASDKIRARLHGLRQLREAGVIFSYVSMFNEPDTYNVIHDLLDVGKHICVPRLDDHNQMQAHRIRRLDELKEGDGKQLHIPVPAANAPIQQRIDVALVPGLAFTESGERLGQGGGHYDKFLADHPDVIAIGLCYSWQIVKALPTEPHDQFLDMVVTERQIYTCTD